MTDTPEKVLTSQEKWRVKNPLAHWAHASTRSAIRRGLLVKADICERCGSTDRIDGHHPSYRDPLVVEWLCRPCHKAEHRRLKKGGS